MYVPINIAKMLFLNFKSIFFFFNSGCPAQLTRTTTNFQAHWTFCKPSEHVRYRGGDRRAQWSLNPGAEEGNKSLQPLGHNLKCTLRAYLISGVETVWKRGCISVFKIFNYFLLNFFLYFLNRFNALILKIIFLKNIKKYYFDKFQYQKHFKK